MLYEVITSGFPKLRGIKRASFSGQKRFCKVCKLRSQCLRYPDKTEIRQVTCPVEAVSKNTPADFAEKMKNKIDSVVGKTIYAKRIATAEPPFAHIRHVMGLRRFSLRGKIKISGQCVITSYSIHYTKLYEVVSNNLLKIKIALNQSYNFV